MGPNDAAAEERAVVRIYDTAPDSTVLRAAAIGVAAAIVEHGGVAVDWRDCTDRGAQPECQDARGPRNFIVRLMPTFVGGTRGPRIAIETRKNTGASESELGFAVIDPRTLAGTIATVFHDRVLMVARRAGVERSQLLGRALAHEVGHLLLESTGHSRTGLMRPVWTDGELTQNLPHDWLFADTDRMRLQRTP